MTNSHPVVLDRCSEVSGTPAASMGAHLEPGEILVAHATERIETGQRITVDGSAGTITTG